MPTRVKICGITREQDARLAVELGAAALGFNFYPPSPRFVTPEAARGIMESVPPLVLAVGVFAEESDARHVARVARRAGVSAVQLHASSFRTTENALRAFRMIRAVAVREGMKAEELAGLKADALLLDAFDTELRGGTGKSFDWNFAREAARFGTIILAGGLTPENICHAVLEARPFAVDVASGVESSPGIKDPGMLRAFFAAVAKADREIEVADSKLRA
jgi:phosphoribosylanthranilate isomerase